MPMKRAVHMTGKDLADMVQLRPQDIAKYVIMPGPPDRLEALAKKITNPIRNFTFMEHTMYTGAHKGIPVTCMNGGLFSANTAITSEIVCNVEAKTIIRTGSCGAMSESIKIGDLILATGIIRGDGVSPHYVADDVEISPDQETTAAVEKAAEMLGARLHKGIVWSTDAMMRETKEVVDEMETRGAIAVDMVTSTLLTVAHVYGVKAASLLVVSDNLMTGELGFTNPAFYFAQTAQLNIALKAVEILEGK